MARYRLRFLLQEIDLPQGETLIGRSVNCHVTIEDPLVSRRHARIVVSDERVTVEDLGSRNGLLVAGRAALGVVDVTAGARLRVGTQELVLCRLSDDQPAPRRAPITGFMIHCAGCGFPYAAEQPSCPHCGSTARHEEATLSGSTKQAWSLDLIAETVSRAEALGRWQDVERVLLQGQRLVGEILAQEEPVDEGRVDCLARAAVTLALEQGRAEWARWALGLYVRRGRTPPAELGRSFESLPPDERATLLPAAEAGAVRHLAKAGQVTLDEVTLGDAALDDAALDDALETEPRGVEPPEDDESPRGAGLVG